MKTRRIIKGLSALLTIGIEFISLGLLGYALFLYNGIETFYRIYGVIILLYIASFLSYLILKQCVKTKMKSFLIVVIISLLFSIIQCAGYYYLTKVYQAINAYSNTNNMYSSSLVTYNTKLDDYKDLKNMKIGIIKDTNEIEGNVLPKYIIKELKLDDNNEIVEYESSIELLVSLKDKEIDAAFFSSNYIDIFYSLEGFEEIEKETKELYKKEKEYDVVEDTHDTSTSSFNKPFNILFIGVDSSNDGVTSGYNADVLILVSFNPTTLEATMTSIPRDMYMKTACSGSSYRRINTTTWGSSSSCAVKTVENLFDVNIDYYAKINFKGVVQLVDSVGGIDVFVDYPLCDQNSSRSWGNGVTVMIEGGQQHLNGEQALALARNRHKAGDGSSQGEQMRTYCPTWTEGERSDYTRGKNQLKVIMGVIKAATKLTDVNQAVKILEDISSNFQTNIKSNDVMELYGLGKAILFSQSSSNLINVQRMQLKGYNFNVWDTNSKSRPSVTIPYNGSIKDIKNEIKNNINPGNNMIKTCSFDINNPYKDNVLGQGNYSQSKLETLKDVSSYSVDAIKSYASSKGLTLRFIDTSNGSEVKLNSWDNYSFSYQSEHPDAILSLFNSLTIYVKKKEVLETSAQKKEEVSSQNTEEVSTQAEETHTPEQQQNEEVSTSE